MNKSPSSSKTTPKKTSKKVQKELDWNEEDDVHYSLLMDTSDAKNYVQSRQETKAFSFNSDY